MWCPENCEVLAATTRFISRSKRRKDGGNRRRGLSAITYDNVCTSLLPALVLTSNAHVCRHYNSHYVSKVQQSSLLSPGLQTPRRIPTSKCKSSRQEVLDRLNKIMSHVLYELGTVVTQLLRRCATNRKVAGSIPDGVTGFFIHIKPFRSHYGPGVDSASNRKEYQEYFLGVKAAGA